MGRFRTAMSVGLAVAAAVAALSLSACGGENDPQLNAQIDKSTHDSCVSSASSRGLTAAQVETYCTCVVRELDKLPLTDKVQLPMHKEKLIAAADTCNAQLANSSASPATNAP